MLCQLEVRVSPLSLQDRANPRVDARVLGQLPAAAGSAPRGVGPNGGPPGLVAGFFTAIQGLGGSWGLARLSA